MPTSQRKLDSARVNGSLGRHAASAKMRNYKTKPIPFLNTTARRVIGTSARRRIRYRNNALELLSPVDFSETAIERTQWQMSGLARKLQHQTVGKS
jgi:hypothetical protein